MVDTSNFLRGWCENVLRNITSRDGSAPTVATPSIQSRVSFGLKIVQPSQLQLDTTSSRTSKTVNVIFIHGLGSSARGAWTHENGSFWPEWLHTKDELKEIRTMTFGYDANRDIFAPANALGIPDFAKQLLQAMRLHYRKLGEVFVSVYGGAESRHLRYLWLIAWVDWWSRRSVELTRQHALIR